MHRPESMAKELKTPSRSDLASLIEKLPKTELHLHIEGTLEPELMFALAQRNNVPLRFGSIEAVREAYQFTNLQSFLDIYYEGAGVLLNAKDFYDLTWAYVERAHAHNIKHTEIFFDPQTHTTRGVSFEAVIKGINAALTDAKKKYGMTSHLIMCFLRHLDEASALDTLSQASPYRDWITAVGLDSSEVGHPPEKFKSVFQKARESGLLTVAHAGEEGPPEYIWQALELLEVKRIDHGVRCLEDPRLVKHLAAERVPLTVCPLSNLKLKVVDSMADHPIRDLLNAGICATVNSDDPAYFGGYVMDNYLAMLGALDLTAEEVATLVKNGFEASFLSDESKESFEKVIDEILAEYKFAE